MASQVPPVRASAWSFKISLFGQSDNERVDSPTIAAGDFKISKDDGATANLASTPTVTPAASGIVKVSLSATEMTADDIVVTWKDASGAEWWSGTVNIKTAAQTFDTMDSNIDAILVDTDELQTDDVPGLIAALNDISAADVNTQVDSAWTTQMADSVPTDGTLATREQMLYMIGQFLMERVVTGTSVAVKKVDGSTNLITLTLDDATTPTSITRSG